MYIGNLKWDLSNVHAEIRARKYNFTNYLDSVNMNADISIDRLDKVRHQHYYHQRSRTGVQNLLNFANYDFEVIFFLLNAKNQEADALEPLV
ncbi:uncharacterized protein PRCAT00005326001 [Priceomyces carsonii]|uniref:uncharacterized protein n=1 Tax=Priceomyces carsonii TaxID=28549 RepID=UPI002ED82BCE|nr:unnamed protein product [Priceomyces carsonii]